MKYIENSKKYMDQMKITGDIYLGVAEGAIWKAPLLHKNFQAKVPLFDGTLESSILNTEGAMRILQNLSGKKTGI